LKRPLDARELLTAKSWEVTAELAERQLGELPLISSLGLDEQLAPLRVGLHAQVGHAPRSEPDGTFEAQLRWEPPRTLRRASAICTDRASGRALLAAKWAQERLGVELSGGARSDDTVKVSARTRLLFSELLAGRVRELAGFQLAAKLQDLNLQDVPVACRYGSGRVSLDARARDVFSPTADVELSLQSKGVSWQGSPPLDVDLRARSTDRAMRVAGKLGTAAGQLSLDGLLPVDVHVAQPSGMVRRNDPTQVDLRLSHMPMASLLAFVPGVARVSGTTTGELSVRGSVQAPVLAGKLELDDVSLTIPRLGQRFSHLHLQATVDGSTVRLSEGRVKDLDGSASIAALLKLRSLDEWRAEINLNTRNFPLRKTGLILGRVDATAHIAAAMTRERTQVDVTLNDVAIALSSEDVGSVQSLDPHPEFSFVDARVTDSPAEPEEPVEPVEREKSAIPTVIRLISKDGVWVRRDDFAVEMQTDLTITLGQAKPLLHGEIKLLRGYLSLFGQSFDIERGRVVLGGGEKVDPQLEITATHDTPGGSSVRVEVTGFASEPQLAFFVADKAVTARDALIAITGGGRTNTSARGPEQEIAAAAVGMTTGLLTLGARREFGDWVPMLAIEQGAGTRVRVGVDADQFIPSFLKGFVRGAYVEGIVSTQNDASGRTATPSSTASTSAMSASGTGVLLELMLPSHFVWAGQYGPGQAWSIDLDWRP
jgi:autotransporter translocation and assembly factor TamB